MNKEIIEPKCKTAIISVLINMGVLTKLMWYLNKETKDIS